MKIENIKIRPFEKEGSKLRAFVSATCNDISIYGMTLVDGKEGLFVSFPNQMKDGKYTKYNYVSMSKEDHEELNNAVINQFNTEKQEQKIPPEQELPF